MGKFKEIDQLCKEGDRDGLVAFLAEHGIQNPHKQANIYLEEYRMNKSDKIEEGIKKQSILDKILEIMSERISTLNERADVLSSRIDIVNERVDNIIEWLEKSGGK
mgnify:CR=1 FL=1|jgi:hypothetical protein|tara:strand:- start:265 stop:582 length:318 start_codon:yes stop_codon:yes gene_type:complete